MPRNKCLAPLGDARACWASQEALARVHCLWFHVSPERVDPNSGRHVQFECYSDQILISSREAGIYLSYVFISYKTEDRREAQSVRVALRAELGCDVWWDQDLQTGGQWSQDIDAALSSAACVVVLWSKRSVHSQWVQQEAAVAKALGILAPAQIDDCVIPSPYAGIQAARLINWQGSEKDAEFAKLASRVKACLVNHSSRRPPSSQLRKGSLGEPVGAGDSRSLRTRIENNLVLWALGSLLTGFVAGFGAYETILKTAQLETVRSSTIEKLEAEIQSLKRQKAALETKLVNSQSDLSQHAVTQFGRGNKKPGRDSPATQPPLDIKREPAAVPADLTPSYDGRLEPDLFCKAAFSLPSANVVGSDLICGSGATRRSIPIATACFEWFGSREYSAEPSNLSVFCDTSATTPVPCNDGQKPCLGKAGYCCPSTTITP